MKQELRGREENEKSYASYQTGGEKIMKMNNMKIRIPALR